MDDQGQMFDDSVRVGTLADRFVPGERDHVLHQGDGRDLLAALPDESVGLTVTSPPYGIGKNYESFVDVDTYIRTFGWIIDELARVTAPTGSVCWQVGNHITDGEIVPLDVLYYPLFRDRGFRLRNRIVWTFGHGLHASNRFSGRYEMILWFTRGDEYVFNLDDVRVPSRYPGKKHHKGERRGELSGHPLGKNPADVWQVIAQEWETGMLDVPNVKHNHPEKTDHPCQFPIEVAQRCILATTEPGAVICDPFGGSGSTLLAAAIAGRRGVLAEQYPPFCDIIRQRFRHLQRGELAYRKIGTPIFEPSVSGPDGHPSMFPTDPASP